jgi:hypothetical protein
MDRTETGTDRAAAAAEESGTPPAAHLTAPPAAPETADLTAHLTAPETAALFRPGREVQRLAEDWAALRRDAFLLDQRLRGVEARLVAIEGRSTGDAHAKLALLTQVLRHDLGLAPDHRAVLLASGALAALECVHRAAAPPETAPAPP